MMTIFLNTRQTQKSSPFSAFYLPILLGLILTSQPAVSNSALNKSLNQAEKMITQGQTSQQLIDKTIDETHALDTEFKQLSKSLEQININLSHQQQLQTQQQQQISSLTRQLEAVSTTEDSIIPLMLTMIDWLDTHIESDLPFYLAERKKRIASIKSNILSPSMPLAEIYRAVLDAYQVESEYGYSVESYHQNIELSGQTIESQILRIGRVGLYYLTLDGAQGGFWNRQTQQWQAADNAELKEISQGILIAKKQLPHTLLSLPVSVGDQK